VLDLDTSRPPATLLQFWDRFVRAFTTVQDVKIFRDVDLVTGSEGNLLRHELKAPPKTATVQVKGASASTAIVTLDPAIGSTFLKLYTSADCTADVVVYL
jgi:hypothetical protein